MDQPGLDPQKHRAALAALRRVNWISTSVPMLWRELRRIAHESGDRRPLRVLDVACGSGDVVIRLAKIARREGIAATFEGCDVSDTAIEVARGAAAQQQLPAVFFRHDALRQPFPADYDVVMCSLFLHHLANEDAVNVLRNMSQAARQAVLIDDLLRTWLGFVLCWFGVHLLSLSSIVHNDGLCSVQAAFTEQEVRTLAAQAGWPDVRLHRHWPERFLLCLNRSPS